MDVESFITRQEYLIVAMEMKEGKSEDYVKGFDDGANWLAQFIHKLTKPIVKDNLGRLK